jgi:ATP-dependent Lon protease
MTRHYLEWLLALPWSKLDKEEIDIDKARRILDEDHFGLETIKRRIIEFLAVRKLNPEGHSPILCFVGPRCRQDLTGSIDCARARAEVRAREPGRGAR